jgi:anhydro-N-acetylmuramic acid kinase
MKKFHSLLNKKNRTVIGVLSGTSVDAVDVVLVKIKGNGFNSKIRIIDFDSFSTGDEIKKFILRCSTPGRSNVEDICRLNFIVGYLFSKSVNKLIFRNKLLPKDIDLIGSHGQTIYHIPFNKKLFSFDTKSTLQVGDPSVIANQTGIITVGDFRVADVAVKGDGAPLVPYLDYLLFRHKTRNRVFVNIGGISNITYLKKSCNQKDVIAFDTGPGNIIIDLLSKRYFNRKFDTDGRFASKGKVNEDLLAYVCRKDKFYKKKPPKSTGREHYSEDFIVSILNKFISLKPEDVMATFTRFTAFSLYHNLKNYDIDEIILSGGGANNPSLVKDIREYFIDKRVEIMNEDGINPDNKEAVLFAVLANELISGNKANLPSVTGSIKNVFLGKICLA